MPKRIKVEPSNRFKRSFAKLPPSIQKVVIEKEAIFVNNPFDKRLRTHKLKGKLEDFWSFSVSYTYRIVFEFVKKDEAIFYDIGDHRIYQ